MNNLPENYFQTHGPVTLPGIDETIQLPRRVWFRYDGEVPSLVQNVAETGLIISGRIDQNRSRIQRLLDWPVIAVAKEVVRQKIPNIDNSAALCHSHDVHNGRIRAYVIAKMQGLKLSDGVFADGHESGEFLQSTKMQQALQDALEQENVKLNTLLYDGEDFANIGGLLALRRGAQKGMEISRIPTFKGLPDVLPEQVKAFGL